MQRIHWQEWIAAVIGLWLIALPFALNFDLPESASSGWIMASFIGAGAVIAGMASLAMLRDETWEDAGIMVAGAWLLISPWLLNFSSDSPLTWNALICGGATVMLAAWSYGDGFNWFKA